MISWEDYLKTEKQDRERVSVKLAYIDMTGDLATGVLLSQIIYWYLPGKDRQSKLTVEHDGHRWIAKARGDWWDEVRLTPRQVDRCIKRLEELGLIITKTYKFNGVPKQHLRLNIEKFLQLWSHPTSPNGEVRLHESVTSPNGKVHFTGRGSPYITDTTTDTTNKKIMSGKPDPAAEVLQYLNEKAQTHYRLSKTSLRPIHGRLKDGASIDDLKLVVDFKAAEWLSDEKMRQYLRPKTLFGPENFEGYLAAAKTWAGRGRPVVNGAPKNDDYIRALKEDIAQLDRYIEYQIDARLAKLDWKRDLTIEEEEEKERLMRIREEKVEERNRLIQKLERGEK